jgi:hypothetical protein
VPAIFEKSKSLSKNPTHYLQFMTKIISILLSLILLTACNNDLNKAEQSLRDSIADNSKNVVKYQAPSDSIDIEFIPIYNGKTKSTKNISIAICSFDKLGCYLNLKFNYSNKSTIVINSCNGQDSLQLYEWNKKTAGKIKQNNLC